MSTDRELLELAAKAAGIVIDYSHESVFGGRRTGFDLLGNAVLDWHNGTKWNPLTDDGDRYRLARQCGLIVDFDGCEVRFYLGAEETVPRVFKWAKGDAKAEALAIVRAAAEIAKSTGGAAPGNEEKKS